MSALKCPVCEGAFREVLREGILIDVCTQCRGVWLDRGELEKLLAFAREEQPESFEVEARAQRAQPAAQPARDPNYQEFRQPVQPQQQPYPDQRSHYRRDDDDDKKRYYSKDSDKYYVDKYGNRKKKKGFDMFDIFDFD